MNSVLKYYKTKDYKELFQYFFDLYVTAFTIGVATEKFEEKRKVLPNISIDENNEIKNFLLECTSYLKEAFTPNILSILIERQYLECIKIDTSKEQQSMMKLSWYLIEGIHQFDIKKIFDTERLWNDDIKCYAEKNFYPKLPKVIRKKYDL